MPPTKHAFCIIAHNDKYCLETLLSLIDDERNDIFLLIDKKTPPQFEDGLKVSKSRLKIIDRARRIDTRWGHISLVEAELLVIGEALLAGEYGMIHLLSGADLPIKSQNYIHDFFQKNGTDKIYMTVNEDGKGWEEAARKSEYRHFFTRHQNSPNRFAKLFFSCCANALLIFQKIFGIKRKWGEYKIAKGSNWISVPADFAKYLVGRKDIILKKFRRIKCADELFVQSEAANSPFFAKIFRNSDGRTDHFLKIVFDGTHPRVFTQKDFNALIESEDLFARKFSSKIDRKIIDLIYNKVKSDQ